MANSFDSNFTRKVMRIFLEKFESARVHSRNVDTQLLAGKFNPSTGDTIDFKRPTDYTSKRTPAGDISALARSDIITGKASGIVQDYFTVDVEFDEADQAIKMDQLDELLEPMAQRIVTDFELDFANFMMLNTGLLAGNVGTAATTWDHVAEAGAMLMATGVPMDARWYYTVNPFTQIKLASNQRALGSGGTSGALIKSAHEQAILTKNFAGMQVLAATTLPKYTTDSEADRVGAITSNPDVTYLTAKDTMTQAIVVKSFGNDLVVKAGETLQITGRNRLNLSTREVILDDSGAEILFTGTVVADVTLSGTGTGTLVITGPAIFEALGAFNTVDSAPVTNDVLTLLGAASDTVQPNLFWHTKAFSVGSVPIKKLFSTDTIGTTKDGLQLRVSKFADGNKNLQIVRVDFRPAFAALNPFFAGQGFGS